MSRRKPPAPASPAPPALTLLPAVGEVVPPVADSGRNSDEAEDDGEGLSAREIRFCDLLATGTTPREAATQVGISERSGRRWRQKLAIIAATRSRLNDSISVGRSILACGFAQAATALVAMASGGEPADSSRIAACRAITSGAIELIEADVEARLSALEQQGPPGPGLRGRWRP